MTQSVQAPLPLYLGLDGQRLQDGYLYFGVADLNPETNPVIMYWDAALTQPAGQPIRTINGMPSRNGTPAMLYTNTDHSITIRDSAGRLVLYVRNSLEFTIEGQLANASIANFGAGMVGYNPALSYGTNTVGAALNDAEDQLARFLTPYRYGAVGDGVADDTQPLVDAIAAAATLNLPLQIYGRFRYTSQLTLSTARIMLVGQGITSDESTAGRSRSCLIKDFNGLGILVSGDEITIDNIQLDSVVGRTGDILQITGSRFKGPILAVTNAGQDGVRIGNGESTINANLFYFGRLAALNCGRYGVNIDNPNSNISGNYPLGLPNVNAGYIGLLEADRNDVDGLRIGNAIDNCISLFVAQTNTGYGARFSDQARGNVILKSYTELNVAGQGIIEAGATQNVIFSASRAVTLSSGWTNNGGNSNLLIEHTSGVGQDGNFNSSPWTWGPEFYAVNTAAAGQVFLGGYVEAAQLPAWWRIQIHGASGTKATLVTKRDGNSPVDRLSVDSAGTVVLENSLNGFLIGKTVSDVTTPGIQVGNSGSGSNTRIDMVGAGSSGDTKIAFYNSNGQVGAISTSGTATSYAISSDYRLKMNARPASLESILTKVAAWPLIEFSMKATPDIDQIGFLAHELQMHVPEAVTGEKDGLEIQGVDYSKLVPYLIAAVQLLISERGN